VIFFSELCTFFRPGSRVNQSTDGLLDPGVELGGAVRLVETSGEKRLPLMNSSEKTEAHVVVAALEPAAEADLGVAQELGQGLVLFAGQLDLEAAVDQVLSLRRSSMKVISGANFLV